MTQRVLIAGGGITGLSTAYHVQKRARAAGLTPEIILIERDNRLGGQIQTQVVEDLIIEEAPDSFLVRKPWLMQLCHELGLTLVGTNDQIKKTYILNHGELEPIPEGMQLFIPTKLKPFAKSRLMSQSGKLRAMLEPVIPIRHTDEDESAGHFIARRFGREMVDKIGAPLIAGVYGGDPYELSLQATFPQFLTMERERGSLLKAARKTAPAKGTTGSLFQTVKGGLHSIVEALVAATPDVQYQTGRRLTGLKQVGTKQLAILNSGETLEVDAVVLTLPAFVTADLVAGAMPDLALELEAIEYASAVVVALAYNRIDVMHPMDATGFLVPSSEGLPITASTWVSSKWPHMAVGERVLLRAFLGRSGDKDWASASDAEIVTAVTQTFEQVMGLTADPVLIRVFRWPQSRPRYKVGHVDRVQRIEAMVKQVPGLYLAGAAYRGLGLPDCVRDGAIVADGIAAQLNW
jgi:protoporphyrinogen/coproporphyrinogen III oxidase